MMVLHCGIHTDYVRYMLHMHASGLSLPINGLTRLLRAPNLEQDRTVLNAQIADTCSPTVKMFALCKIDGTAQGGVPGT
jgi:hypothetical protein